MFRKVIASIVAEVASLNKLSLGGKRGSLHILPACALPVSYIFLLSVPRYTHAGENMAPDHPTCTVCFG